jgi:hypothetical protein
MTEAEWLASTDPKPMLVFLRDETIDRQLRLFALGCCRRIDEHITDPRCRAAIEYSERVAEGGTRGWRGRPPVAKGAKLVCAELDRQHRTQLSPEEYSRLFVKINAAYAAQSMIETNAYLTALFCSGFASNVIGWASAHATAPGPLPPLYEQAQLREKATQTRILRDVLGPFPFRSVPVDPVWLRWNNGTIPKIADSIYEERAFDRLPILADALEDAGCDNADILTHCRNGGEHVRGCWVVDLLLGKS